MTLVSDRSQCQISAELRGARLAFAASAGASFVAWRSRRSGAPRGLKLKAGFPSQDPTTKARSPTKRHVNHWTTGRIGRPFP